MLDIGERPQGSQDLQQPPHASPRPQLPATRGKGGSHPTAKCARCMLSLPPHVTASLRPQCASPPPSARVSSPLCARLPSFAGLGLPGSSRPVLCAWWLTSYLSRGVPALWHSAGVCPHGALLETGGREKRRGQGFRGPSCAAHCSQAVSSSLLPQAPPLGSPLGLCQHPPSLCRDPLLPLALGYCTSNSFRE